jgi:TPR repeat protein
MLYSKLREIETFIECGNFEAAAAICELLENREEPVALTLLGSLHEHGLIEGADAAKAMWCYERASSLGFPLAFHLLGAMLVTSGKDARRGRRLLRRAARMGYVPQMAVGSPWVIEDEPRGI